VEATEERRDALAEELKTIDRETGVLRTAPAKPAPERPKSARTLSVAYAIRNDPEAQVWHREAEQARVRVTYGPFFRNIALSPEKQAAFVASLAAKNERFMDLEALALEDNADTAAIAKLRSQTIEDYNEAQRQLLSPADFSRLQDYEKTAWLRQMVGTMAGVMVLEGAPLTPARANELVEIIARGSSEHARGGQITMNTVDWAEVEPRLRAVLSPAQYEVFTRMDPGPTAGGLQQNLLYAEVSRANARTRSRPPETPPGQPSPVR
jgi:hypothetical protein